MGKYLGIFTGSKTALLPHTSGTLKRTFGKTDMPEPPEPKVAPVPDDEERRAAMQRRTQRRYAGQGRSGTVLTSPGNTLG